MDSTTSVGLNSTKIVGNRDSNTNKRKEHNSAIKTSKKGLLHNTKGENHGSGSSF